ncbi:hypothetical protein R4673_10045 [Acinetobacter baumannii]|nr:hypothetical protein [Acinetobacter baumannii]
MTVQVSDRLSQLYVGNGVNTRFDFMFRAYEQEDETGVGVRIKVGNEFEFIDESEYTVTTNPDNMGGYVTFVNPPSAETFFYIAGKTPVDQLLDITNYDNFYPDALERALDKITAILQEWNHLVDFETQARILADIAYDDLAKEREADLKAYIDGIASAITGRPVLGLPSEFVVDGNDTQKQINDKSVRNFESIADLLTYTPRNDGQVVYVKGYHAPTNFALAQPYKGGGHRTFVESRRNENDGFLCINGWVLQIENNTVTPEQAGCHGDNTHDDYAQLQKVLKSELKVECDAFANYRISKPVEMFTGQKIKGNGAKITKYSSSTTGITGRTDPAGNPYNYDQDCAVVFAAWYGWYSYIDIENLTIVKEKVNGEDVGKVFFAPYISMSTLKSVVVKGGEHGFFGEDLWMMNWNRCEAYSKEGFHIMTGTSNTFNTCWSKETKAGYSAFRLHNLTYSALINCCAEHVGEDGAPADAAYHITNSDLKMIGCGIEGIHAYNLIRAGYSWITIDNPSFIYGINNKYRHATYTGLIDIDSSDSVVTLRGGRIANINSGVFADAVRVNGGTFNYESPLWVGVGFPDDTSDFKIRVSNWAAILDLSSFTGRKYTYNGRAQTWINKTPTQFNGGIMLNDLGAMNLKDIRKHAYFGSQGSGASGSIANGYPVDGFGGVVLNFASGDDGVYTNAVQLALPVNTNTPYFRRAGWSEGFTTWFKFLTSGNTAIDANGFIKAASPIVKLYADKIELNDEAAQQTITFEKVSLGSYLVKGSLGFATEGWYIETPKDANGNILFAVQYKQLENNDIEVKTFKKKFDFESASIVADLSNPVDIPLNRWIDLRLKVAPKPELIESTI